MEEKLIQKYLEQLEEGRHDFLKKLTPSQQWELGSWASHREKTIHLGNFDWNSERSDLTNLDRLFGAGITDYGWSVYDTPNGELVDNLPFIMGAMAGLGFQFVGFAEDTWYEADENLTSSMDEEDRQKILSETFRLRIRFYPNRPGSDRAPAFCCPNNMETAEQVLEYAQDRSWIVQTKNRLWFSCYEVTPRSKKYDVLSKLEVIEPRMTMDRENIVFHSIKDWHELVLFRNSILLVKYKQDVVAFGPDAILLA